ncbi:MAG: iron-containing alcohol dehydrogenase [Dehalococcoidales bacterium]
MLPVKTFRVPQVVITGSGSSKQVGEECKKLGLKKALIVTDQNLVKLGIPDGVKESLQQNGVEHATYDGVNSEPAIEHVQEGLEAFRGNGCDFLLAVGGGSPMDTAKAISAMATNQGSIEDYMGQGKIPERGKPVIAVPTTAGTGSEVTPFSIITDTRRDVKMLIGSPFLTPAIAVVDPQLTISLPQDITAATGIDALTHAIEAYVSVKVQPMSDVLALAAIELIAGNLEQAWSDGKNLEAREKTMMGSLMAGMAFSNSSVALVHGMARPIGAYFHVRHGASNAALLGTVMEFSLEGNPARYARIAEAMGVKAGGLSELEAAQRGAEAVKKLIKDVRIPSMRELGVGKEKLEQLAPKMSEDAIASGSPGNNPRQATKEEIIELYKVAYGE